MMIILQPLLNFYDDLLIYSPNIFFIFLFLLGLILFFILVKGLIIFLSVIPTEIRKAKKKKKPVVVGRIKIVIRKSYMVLKVLLSTISKIIKKTEKKLNKIVHKIEQEIFIQE